MSAAVSMAVIGASRWLDAKPAGPMSTTIAVAQIARVNSRTTSGFRDFILHLMEVGLQVVRKLCQAGSLPAQKSSAFEIAPGSQGSTSIGTTQKDRVRICADYKNYRGLI